MFKCAPLLHEELSAKLSSEIWSVNSKLALKYLLLKQASGKLTMTQDTGFLRKLKAAASVSSMPDNNQEWVYR